MTSTYEQDAEHFLAEVELEYYENGAGLKETFDLSAIYARHEHLFTADRVHELLAARDTKPGRYLAQFAAFQYLERSVCALTDEITTAETQSTVAWEGEPISYRRGLALVPVEPDPARRRDLVRRVHAVTGRHNSLRTERLTQLHSQAERLGFASYCDLCDELLGIRLGWLSDQMRRFLSETEAAWCEMLGRYLDGLGISLDEAHIVDLRHVLTAPQMDRFFPQERLLPVLTHTLNGLGIDLEALANPRVDTEERALKSHRPFCCRIHVPSDVRLVALPRGGRDHYMMLLHEAGHALHGAYTRPDAPFAFRCLGDNTVTEAYAFLLALLVNSPAWLGDVAAISADASYLDFTRFHQLYYLRRVAARLAYERELHAVDRPAIDFAQVYARRLGDALRVEMAPENYLADVDDWLYSACYLRAWMLEVQLRRRLIDEFGERWFASRQAGDFIKELWRLGQEFSAEELAQRLGYPGLQIEPLIADVMSPADS